MSRNRFNNLSERYYRDTENCIFISHQKDDSNKARKIADYFVKSGIDVYFDEYDKSINRNDPYSVVNAIRRGINNSTKMLCFYTRNSQTSKWIPWEVGYAYGTMPIVCLTEKELCNIELPDYLKIVEPLRGIESLNNYISRILGKSVDNLISETKLFSAVLESHPLYDILQWNK